MRKQHEKEVAFCFSTLSLSQLALASIIVDEHGEKVNVLWNSPGKSSQYAYALVEVPGCQRCKMPFIYEQWYAYDELARGYRKTYSIGSRSKGTLCSKCEQSLEIKPRYLEPVLRCWTSDSTKPIAIPPKPPLIGRTIWDSKKHPLANAKPK